MRDTLRYVGVLTCCAALGVSVSFFASYLARSARDQNAPKAAGDPAPADFKGYEGWRVISVSHDDGRVSIVLGNGARMARLQARDYVFTEYAKR